MPVVTSDMNGCIGDPVPSMALNTLTGPKNSLLKPRSKGGADSISINTFVHSSPDSIEGIQ